MKTTYSLLLVLAFLLPCRWGISQTMSNTDNVITLSNTCMNAGLPNGTYTLQLNYYDLDQNTSPTVTIPGVSVVISSGVMTITAPPGSFPSLATNGWWSLPDAFPGRIALTSGTFSTLMYWYQNPNGSTGFNCVALPIYYNSFSGIQSGSNVVLNWQTGLEQNSTFFEIYRSSNAGSYYKIGQVAASGNSSGAVNYSFTDVNPDATNYYYLKELNNAGSQAIFSKTISVVCSSCHYTPPTPVSCNYTINGPDYICSQGTAAAYSLSSAIPNYNTISWSADQSYAASLRAYPDFDRTKVTLLKKDTAGSITLTAAISGCTNAITKTVVLGTPTPKIDYSVNCPNISVSATNDPGASSFTWYIMDVTTGVETINPSGPAMLFSAGSGDNYNVALMYGNGCGISPATVWYTFRCDPGGGEPELPNVVRGPSISPNPTTGVVTISLPMPTPAAVLSAVPAAASAKSRTIMKSRIYQAEVVDGRGVVRKTFRYAAGMESVSVNLSDLNSGIYTLRVFDGTSWRSSQLLLTK